MSPTEALRGFTLIACECKLIGFRSWRLWQTFTYGYESHGSIFEIALDCKFAIMTSVRTESPPKKIFTRHFLSSWQQIYIREKVGSVPVATPPPKKKNNCTKRRKSFCNGLSVCHRRFQKYFFGSGDDKHSRPRKSRCCCFAVCWSIGRIVMHPLVQFDRLMKFLHWRIESHALVLYKGTKSCRRKCIRRRMQRFALASFFINSTNNILHRLVLLFKTWKNTIFAMISALI